MREIKFRAWDIENPEEQMLYWSADKQDFDLDVFLDNPDVFVMQYTDLKDKNGKEIYEGDIVRWYKGEEAKVVWWGGEACFTTEPILNGFNCTHACDYEIIGNIYEHPHLLRHEA